MPELTIAWEYLTGYAVAATRLGGDAEWPPHPGRVFMALAAAWFETGEDAAEGDAMRWLETLGDPEFHLPPRERVFERSATTVYVPVNDKAGPAAASLQSAPALTRSKQPRTFPRVWVGDGPCFMRWTNANGADEHRAALDRLCGKVTRIGHSSSLVRMWVADDANLLDSAGERGEHLITDDLLAEIQVRMISTGMLDMLVDHFGEGPRQRHGALTEQIEALKASKKAVKGKGSQDRKGAIEDEIKALESELSGIATRMPVRPTSGLWSGYRRADLAAANRDTFHSHFDTDMLVLTHVDGPQLPVVSTLAVTRAVRDTIMSQSDVQPAPSWVSGHALSGEPLTTEDGHLAYVPLPVVGHEHAEGHLLGLGLMFPRSVDRRDRGQALGKLLLDETGQARPMKLKLGRLGVWTVVKRDWNERRWTLQPETWTAHPEGINTWASVTPVVLDKFPKADRIKNRAVWTEEVAGIVATACKRIGLPEPLFVDVSTTSWHIGSPRAVRKCRPLRGNDGATSRETIMGDGFPPFPAKGTNSSRPQVHVWLRFAEPVVGPVLLGAGRYLGYGLCKPWKEDRR